jgi:hypothetical protein
MGWKQLVGAGIGFLVGGPAGMAVGASLGGAVDEATGGGTAGAVKDAAATANAAAERDLALRTRMYEEGVARQQPFYQAGVNALPQYVSGIQEGGELVRGFTPADFTADPGYGFRFSEGQKALDRQAAARGGLMSGGALKAAQRYGQEMGSQEFGNAYNRFRDTQGLRRNALAGVIGYGPTAASSMNTAGQNYATGAGGVISGQGETSANALLAAQQARSSSYGQFGSALNKYLNPAQTAFGQTSLGGSGFGSGLAYGNQDLGQNF